MGQPRRIAQQAGRHALVDDIPFQMPVQGIKSSTILAAFPCDPVKARVLLQGDEIHPFVLWNKALLLVTVVDYRHTNIGKYIEFSIALACTHGTRPAPRLLPALLRGLYGTGQWVYDLPVSTEISVKGGKGIWGMPKHQCNLNYIETQRMVSSQYDLDGQLGVYFEVARPRSTWLPVSTSAVNYCAFRGLLMKSTIYFSGKAGFSLFRKGAARLIIGDAPRVQVLKTIGLEPDPIATLYLPEVTGVLDDHFESWFLTYDQPPATPPEGLESVVGLGEGQEWLPPPSAPVPGRVREDVPA
ncbi:MAG TPA: acetoacetate decarboxylase family protein [Acetobacteraceae bacterium]|nr:acetoacetate decarboxylase family protein [Acetobacteraceae bacterium]